MKTQKHDSSEELRWNVVSLRGCCISGQLGFVLFEIILIIARNISIDFAFTDNLILKVIS